MVNLYIDGRNMGPVTDLAAVLAEFTAQRLEVELRDEAGNRLGRIVPPEPIIPWHPEVKRADIDRMIAAGGLPLAEVLKRLGAG